jgi:hypothetical protein
MLKDATSMSTSSRGNGWSWSCSDIIWRKSPFPSVPLLSQRMTELSKQDRFWGSVQQTTRASGEWLAIR